MSVKLTSNSLDIIFGLHAVKGVLKTNPDSVKKIEIQQGRHDHRIKDIVKLAKQHQIPVDQITPQALDRLMGDLRHQGVIAHCTQVAVETADSLSSLLEQLKEPPFLLILDGVQDPHNLGACLRTADAAGVHAVIVPKDKAVGITPVVRKVACGAAETLPFFPVVNIARTLRELKQAGVWIYGADADAESTVYETDLTGPIALVLGAEGRGLRRLTQENCDALMGIPLKGHVESLNVSVATGVCLFEAVRQRIVK